MKILALELSSGQGSIAWMEEGRELGASAFANDRKHSGLFFENLQQSIAQFGQADRIVVGLGPGSYAGTRIAIAMAIGLQASTGAELIGWPSICALPADEDEYAVIGDARRQTFFFARILHRRCIDGPTLFPLDELLQRLAATTLPIFSTEPLPQFEGVVLKHPSARILAGIAAHETAPAVSESLDTMYLHDPHITYPKVLPK